MPNVFALTGLPSLARLRVAEIAIAATAPDSPPDAPGDATQVTVTRLMAIRDHLGLELGVVESVDVRLRQRRPVPEPRTLQNLVRNGRRRLERERQAGARTWHDQRRDAADRLYRALVR